MRRRAQGVLPQREVEVGAREVACQFAGAAEVEEDRVLGQKRLALADVDVVDARRAVLAQCVVVGVTLPLPDGQAPRALARRSFACAYASVP